MAFGDNLKKLREMRGISTSELAESAGVAQPEISAMVSALVLLVERAAKKAAFWVWEVWPFIISFITVYASS